MDNRSFFCSLLVTLLLTVPLFSQTPKAGKSTLLIRGKPQDIYLYPAKGESGHLNQKILFAPGDAGWWGFAITIARTAASWGYDVYGLDTKRYLESFTGKTTLKETDVMTDFRQIVEWMTQGSGERVTLVGWSEGAGLCLLAAASEENKRTFNGLISIGMSESSVLGWLWSDDITYITKKNPKDPMFPALIFCRRSLLCRS